jgi:hypothetical protein
MAERHSRNRPRTRLYGNALCKSTAWHLGVGFATIGSEAGFEAGVIMRLKSLRSVAHRRHRATGSRVSTFSPLGTLEVTRCGTSALGDHYECLVHRLTYSCADRNLDVRSYKEEGTITTVLDMRVLRNVVDRLPQFGTGGAAS